MKLNLALYWIITNHPGRRVKQLENNKVRLMMVKRLYSLGTFGIDKDRIKAQLGFNPTSYGILESRYLTGGGLRGPP